MYIYISRACTCDFGYMYRYMHMYMLSHTTCTFHNCMDLLIKNILFFYPVAACTCICTCTATCTCAVHVLTFCLAYFPCRNLNNIVLWATMQHIPRIDFNIATYLAVLVQWCYSCKQEIMFHVNPKKFPFLRFLRLALVINLWWCWVTDS